MKLMRHAFVTFVCVILIFSGCDKNDCGDGDEPVFIETIGFVPANSRQAWLQNTDENKTEVNLVITNEQDYEKYIGVAADISRPDIDFSKYILLAGRYRHYQCARLDDQAVIATCKMYVFQVNIGERDCHFGEPIAYFALIPNTDARIHFDVNLIKG